MKYTNDPNCKHKKFLESTMPSAPYTCKRCGKYKFRIAIENNNGDVIEKNGEIYYLMKKKHLYWWGVNPTLC